MVERSKEFSLEPDPSHAPTAPHLREVAGADHVPNVSLALRMARQRAGHELKDVARVLRIRPSNLEAIESGRFDALPGPTYVTGFLRSYAEYLGLDRDEIVTRYREEIGAASRPELVFPSTNHEGRMPRGWLVFIALLLVVLAYGGWYYYSSQNKGPEVVVAAPPAETSATAAPDAAVTAAPVEAVSPPESTTPDISSDGSTITTPSAPTSESTTPESGSTPSAPEPTGSVSSDGSAPQSSVPTATEPASPDASAAISATPQTNARSPVIVDDAADEAPPEPVSVAQAEDTSAPIAATSSPATSSATAIAAGDQAASAPVAIATPPAPLVASGPSRITISARADAWLQIQGPGNELVVSRILRSGETVAVPDRPGLQMVTGNAGGLEITVDGQLIAPVGPIGVVRRNIVLDANALRSTYGVVNR